VCPDSFFKIANNSGATHLPAFSALRTTAQLWSYCRLSEYSPSSGL
jgi:hypothetical protein